MLTCFTAGVSYREDVLDAAGLYGCLKAFSDEGPFDKSQLTMHVLAAVGTSLVGSVGVLVPGAGVVVDLCKGFCERYLTMKQNVTEAESLQKQIHFGMKRFQDHVKRTLPNCEHIYSKMKDVQHQDLEDFEDILTDFGTQIREMLSILTRANQLLVIMDQSSAKKRLKQFFNAKSASALARML